MLMSSLFGQRTAAPLALLRAALAPRIIETARAQICSVGDASECFEAALSVLSEANDQRFVSCLEQHFRMGIMEMCECTCGELLEPMSYKQCATYVSVPTVLMREGTSLTSQLATVVGPGCPVANCGSRMHIQRYLMQPMPSVITVALVWDAAVASDVGAVLQRVELQLEVHRAFKGITSNVQASLRGMMCTKHCGFFLDGTQRIWQWFDDSNLAPIGEDWGEVVERCVSLSYQPSYLFYMVQPSQLRST